METESDARVTDGVSRNSNPPPLFSHSARGINSRGLALISFHPRLLECLQPWRTVRVSLSMKAKTEFGERFLGERRRKEKNGGGRRWWRRKKRGGRGGGCDVPVRWKKLPVRIVRGTVFSLLRDPLGDRTNRFDHVRGLARLTNTLADSRVVEPSLFFVSEPW